MNRAITALTATALTLGFAGTALADNYRNDHGRNDRYDRRHDNDRRRDDDRRHDNDRRFDRRYDHGGRYDSRPRYRAAPRYDYRWRAPRPHGWYPGWREPYGRGYRYWNDNYYYVTPGAPSVNLSFVVPLR